MRGSSSSLSSRSPSPRRRSSKSNNISIDDFPDVVLIEILCRLSCNILISQCKCVCKHWFTLISCPYFIEHFLRHWSDKKAPIIRTLIDRDAEELNGILPSSKVLTPVMKTLQSLDHFKEKPVVVGTYNDLILCCRNNYSSNDYCICNPYTMQWVALPLPPDAPEGGAVAVGFICDRPYYNYKKEDNEKGHGMQECRYRVVRILPPDRGYPYGWKLEIFCSETGKWRRGVVEFPDENSSYYEFKPFSFAYNGKLYWLDSDLDQNDRLIVIGFDPFSDVYGECSFIELDEPLCYLQYQYFGAYGGCMRLCSMDKTSLVILDLKEDEDGKLCLSKLMDYPLDQNMYPDKESCVGLLPFDPTNEEVEDEDKDVFYIFVDGDVVMYNIRTGKWSKKMVEERLHKYSHQPFPIVLPWWPTPVPTLPQYDQQSSSSSDSMAKETNYSDSMDE